MSTTYEAVLLVGAYLDEVMAEGKVEYEDDDRWDLRDRLEWIDMLHTEDCDFVGFRLPEQQVLNIHTVQEIGKIAKEFEKITGVRATMKACIFTY